MLLAACTGTWLVVPGIGGSRLRKRKPRAIDYGAAVDCHSRSLMLIINKPSFCILNFAILVCLIGELAWECVCLCACRFVCPGVWFCASHLAQGLDPAEAADGHCLVGMCSLSLSFCGDAGECSLGVSAYS